MEQLMTRHKPVRHKSVPNINRQQGVVVFIALIVLVVMTLASLGLIRSIDTATVVAGNLSSKQVSLHVADIGTEAAVNELTTFATTSADAYYPSGCQSNGSCRYYPVMQTLNTQGAPNSINWANVAAVTNTFSGHAAIPAGYSVRYVVERLCSGTLPITNLASNCYALAPDDDEGSKKAGAPVFTSPSNLYYRATIRVSDPKGAETLTQVVLRR